MLSLIKDQQPDVDKICLYVKDPFEWKYQLLINRREKIGDKELKNPKLFFDYWQTIDDVYENLEDYYKTNQKSVNSVWWYDSSYRS